MNTSATGGYLTPTSALPDEDAVLDDDFTEAVEGITGLPGAMVRPRWQPKPPKMPGPTVDWCAIGVSEDDSTPGYPHIDHDGAGDGSSTQSTAEQMTVLASFYGPNARSFVKLLRDGLFLDQNREQLKLKGLYFITTGKIMASPELIDTQWYRRYDLPLYFRRTVARTYAILNIDSAEIDVYSCAPPVHITVRE